MFVEDLSACEAAVRRNPKSAGARLDLAAALMKAGRAAEAAAECHEALRLEPGWADAYISLGFSLLVLGRASDAAGAFERAIEIGPAQSLAHFGLARALVMLADWPGALAEVRVLERFDDLPPELVATLVATIDEALARDRS